MTMLMIIYFK